MKRRAAQLGKAAPCFIAAEKDGVRVTACLKSSAVELTARRNGREVGHAFLDTVKGSIVVGEIEVEEAARRGGVGTRLYEAAVAVGCRAGLPVASDSMRSPYAEAFWRKQQNKGRAACVPGRGSVYDQPTRGRSSDGLPIPGEDDAGDPAWQCERYIVRAPCDVRTLAGLRRRRARK